MKKFLPVVALSLLAAACTSSTPGGMSRWMEAYGNNFPVPQPGLAAVYLVRGNAPPEAPPINITRSGRLAGLVTPNTWLLFEVAPGFHDFRAVGTQESNELIITTAPGETRFLMVSPDNSRTTPSCWSCRPWTGGASCFKASTCRSCADSRGGCPTPAAAALHRRDRRAEGARRRGCLEHARSRARLARLHAGQRVAQPRGVLRRAARRSWRSSRANGRGSSTTG